MEAIIDARREHPELLPICLVGPSANYVGVAVAVAWASVGYLAP